MITKHLTRRLLVALARVSLVCCVALIAGAGCGGLDDGARIAAGEAAEVVALAVAQRVKSTMTTQTDNLAIEIEDVLGRRLTDGEWEKLWFTVRDTACKALDVTADVLPDAIMAALPDDVAAIEGADKAVLQVALSTRDDLVAQADEEKVEVAVLALQFGCGLLE